MATDIGLRLAETRSLAEDLSRRELSLLAGYTHTVINQVESGDIKNPSTALLMAVADVLGTTLDYLAFGRGPAPTIESVREAVAKARGRGESTTPIDESGPGTDGNADTDPASDSAHPNGDAAE